MTDLKVDYVQLEDSRTDLQTLHAEFEHATDRRDDEADIWGHDRVRDAMSGFASNWKLHKEKLLGEIETTHEAVGGCLDAFRETDARTAASLETSTTTRRPGGAS